MVAAPKKANLQPGERFCNQGYHAAPAVMFARPGGGFTQDCSACRAKYRGWSKKTLAEKLAARAPRVDAAPVGRVLWVARSHNEKLGGIPSTISERGTCPPTCGLYEAGCYAGFGKLGGHWKGVGDRGLPWPEFLQRVRALPAGQAWRHNVAGDLAGAGAAVDYAALRAARRGEPWAPRLDVHAQGCRAARPRPRSGRGLRRQRLGRHAGGRGPRPQPRPADRRRPAARRATSTPHAGRASRRGLPRAARRRDHVRELHALREGRPEVRRRLPRPRPVPEALARPHPAPEEDRVTIGLIVCLIALFVDDVRRPLLNPLRRRRDG